MNTENIKMSKNELLSHLAEKFSEWESCLWFVSNRPDLNSWVFLSGSATCIRKGVMDGGVISKNDWADARKSTGNKGCADSDFSISSIRRQASLAEKYYGSLRMQMYCLRRIASTPIPEWERQGCINGYEEHKRKADALLIELTKGE